MWNEIDIYLLRSPRVEFSAATSTSVSMRRAKIIASPVNLVPAECIRDAYFVSSVVVLICECDNHCDLPFLICCRFITHRLPLHAILSVYDEPVNKNRQNKCDLIPGR